MINEIMKLCFMYGIAAVIGYVAILLAGKAAAVGWEWVDDNESKVGNPVIFFVMKLFGFKQQDNKFVRTVMNKVEYVEWIMSQKYSQRYSKEDSILFDVFKAPSDKVSLSNPPIDYEAKIASWDGEIYRRGEDCEAYIVWVGLALVFAPTVIALCVLYYPIALTAGLLVLIAFLARAGRRHNKLFKKHCASKTAHSQGESS